MSKKEKNKKLKNKKLKFIYHFQYVEDFENSLADLGFLKCDWQRNDGPVFSRRGIHEVCLIERGGEDGWVLSIDPSVHTQPSLDNARIIFMQKHPIKTKEDILTALCKWYMLRGEYNIKNRVHLIESEKSSKLRDLVWIDEDLDKGKISKKKSGSDDKIVFEVIT